MKREERFVEDEWKLRKLAMILQLGGVSIHEYVPDEDRLIVYNRYLKKEKEICGYLSYLETNTVICEDDREKAISFYKGKIKGPVELRVKSENGGISRKIVNMSSVEDDMHGKLLVGYTWDVTETKEYEEYLKEKAKKDSLTGLYNHLEGEKQIDEYLRNKDPYATCGMIVVDIDFFKNVNDRYGHLFGDQVLIKFAEFLTGFFAEKDVIMRAGGDEFVILLKDITHQTLLKKAGKLIDAVRELKFDGTDYCMTCSAGVCILPENIAGYTYKQLMENADWALYRAKENGKNRYAFCDNRFRYTLKEKEEGTENRELDARYLHNDIISCAFEIFEKTNRFEPAMEKLMQVIGIRFLLDRITIIRTNVKEKHVSRAFQWTSDRAPEVLDTEGSFTKEDFLTLFHSYDEYGTTVLQHDDMDMYSPDAQKLLMQGEAKTVLYAATYSEGKYTGAISYVVCDRKREWTKQERQSLAEVTKIITAYLSRYMAVNSVSHGMADTPGYDTLTGLLSFSRFKEEVEHKIVGRYADSYVMVYSDFRNFKYFNQRYGYSMGDQLLKAFSNYIVNTLEEDGTVYFSRIVADQFVIFFQNTDKEHAVENVEKINKVFVDSQREKFPDIQIDIRSGIYYICPNCVSASEAIDSANYARKQLETNTKRSACLYDEELCRRRNQERDIVNGIDKALQEKEFKVYLQPKFSLKDYSVVGAEALVRWQKPDGTMLYPDSFIPLYESNGRIVDLDFYVMEQVAEFLAKNKALGRKQIPISVNASILHAANENDADRFLEIMEKKGADVSLLEIELTETATVSEYENAKELFRKLRSRHIRTSMDDFGAGYSVINTIIDIPMDTVKLDRAFIQNCSTTEKGRFFLHQVVEMVKGLGYHVICEGIETEEQAEVMRKIGCEEAQGYLFARPIPMEEFEEKFL